MKCAWCPFNMKADPSGISSITLPAAFPQNKCKNSKHIFFVLIEIKYFLFAEYVCSVRNRCKMWIWKTSADSFLSLQTTFVFIKPIFVFFKHRFFFSSCFSKYSICIFIFFSAFLNMFSSMNRGFASIETRSICFRLLGISWQVVCSIKTSCRMFSHFFLSCYDFSSSFPSTNGVDAKNTHTHTHLIRKTHLVLCVVSPFFSWTFIIKFQFSVCQFRLNSK